MSWFHAKLKPCVVIRIVRMRSPVAVNTAFAIAGRIGGIFYGLLSWALQNFRQRLHPLSVYCTIGSAGVFFQRTR